MDSGLTPDGAPRTDAESFLAAKTESRARRRIAQDPFLRLVMLSLRILVDCIAVWLRLA
jgi:hypothetical protein